MSLNDLLVHQVTVFVIFHRYVTFIKTEAQEEVQLVPEEDLEDGDTSVLEPTVIIKSKRGRTIKQRKFMYNEDEVEEIGRDVQFKKDPSVEIEADPVIVEQNSDTSDIPETKPKISPKPRKRKSKVIEYRCCMCQEKFADDNELISHTESHHSEEIQANLGKKFITRQVYPCTYCNLRFRSKKFREKHFEIPNYKEPPRKRTTKFKPKVNQNIICTYCGKISADIYESRMHELRVHAEDYPIACTFPGCTKRFAAPIIQRKHMRIHAEKRFICDVSVFSCPCVSVYLSYIPSFLIHRSVVKLSLVQSTCKSMSMSTKKKSP